MRKMAGFPTCPDVEVFECVICVIEVHNLFEQIFFDNFCSSSMAAFSQDGRSSETQEQSQYFLGCRGVNHNSDWTHIH